MTKNQISELNQIAFDEHAFVVIDLLVNGEKMTDLDLYCSTSKTISDINHAFPQNQIKLINNKSVPNQSITNSLIANLYINIIRLKGNST